MIALGLCVAAEPSGLRRRLVAVALSRECSLGAHGLLRFRTNDVLLGTSGVGVCVSLVSNSPGLLLFIILCYIGHHVFDLLSHEPVSGLLPPPRAVKVAGSKPATCLTLILFFSPEWAQFLAQVDLRIRTHVITLSAWCVSVFRHGFLLHWSNY